MPTLTTLMWWIGATDGVAIAAMGVIAAVLVIFGIEADWFWGRIAPACGYLVGTSFAAGIVMAITRWLTGV